MEDWFSAKRKPCCFKPEFFIILILKKLWIQRFLGVVSDYCCDYFSIQSKGCICWHFTLKVHFYQITKYQNSLFAHIYVNIGMVFLNPAKWFIWNFFLIMNYIMVMFVLKYGKWEGLFHSLTLKYVSSNLVFLKNFNHKKNIVKGLSSKPSEKCIVVPNFCFLS